MPASSGEEERLCGGGEEEVCPARQTERDAQIAPREDLNMLNAPNDCRYLKSDLLLEI